MRMSRTQVDTCYDDDDVHLIDSYRDHVTEMGVASITSFISVPHFSTLTNDAYHTYRHTITEIERWVYRQQTLNKAI